VHVLVKVNLVGDDLHPIIVQLVEQLVLLLGLNEHFVKFVCVEEARHLVRRAILAVAELHRRLVHHVHVLVVLRLDLASDAHLEVVDVGEFDIAERPVLVRTVVVFSGQEQVCSCLCIHYYVCLIKFLQLINIQTPKILKCTKML
jgi:hypothetical protein